jgi:hypothetical protein
MFLSVGRLLSVGQLFGAFHEVPQRAEKPALFFRRPLLAAKHKRGFYSSEGTSVKWIFDVEIEKLRA